MKEIILGTAGHIDHGKTSLVRALTGIDTDRLKEEKERGITIELGFAFMDLPSGTHVGIVDVPGHERFVKNMVAGVTGIDMVAMIIASDESIMPQTREHLEICSLLGLQHGLIVLTKRDLVEQEWLDMVIEDIKEFTSGTFLENSPIIPVSSATGEGMDQLIKTVDKIAENIPEKSSSGLFRIPVDRVFTMKGFGTVITGTLASGKISVGDTVMIYPKKTNTKIRGIQVHNSPVESARAGMRTAINFQGLDLDEVSRGDVIALPDTLKPSYLVDASFTYLKSNARALKNRSKIRFHAGTAELHGNLILLDQEQVEPGETALVQIRLDTPVTCVKDDRFVLRSETPVRTVGGGVILNPIPKKHKRLKEHISEGLSSITAGDIEAGIDFQIEQTGYNGISFDDMKLMTNLSEKKLDGVMSKLLSDRKAVQVDKENRIYIHEKTLSSFNEKLLTLLTNYHRQNPLKNGMPKEELKSKFPDFAGGKFFNHAIQRLIKDGRVIQSENVVHLSTHKVALHEDQQKVKERILEIYTQSGLTPPSFKQMYDELNIDSQAAKDVLLLLVKEGKIIKAKDDLFFEAGAMKNLEQQLYDFLIANDEISAPLFKDMTGLSRKYLIPLLEYFDSINFTIRIGDTRKLRKRT
ncbi:selenocysteine-specific translation elongation factor [Desulforegula conservatrix]|uniref:selenocysteine-specific translation elongation factor n=1 Tax=Desulforegula conservatrix TaxID=153026 RepID=UPI0004124CAE|nr:selenocysteine-specific translation elongation factor [Desulforegula conservatrix]